MPEPNLVDALSCAWTWVVAYAGQEPVDVVLLPFIGWLFRDRLRGNSLAKDHAILVRMSEQIGEIKGRLAQNAGG